MAQAIKKLPAKTNCDTCGKKTDPVQGTVRSGQRKRPTSWNALRLFAEVLAYVYRLKQTVIFEKPLSAKQTKYTKTYFHKGLVVSSCLTII
jgi:hypothetical protein